MENLKRTVIMIGGKIVKQCWTLGDLNYPLAWSDREINQLVCLYRHDVMAYTETVNIQWEGN